MSDAEILQFQDNLGRFASRTKISDTDDLEFFELTESPIPVVRKSLNLSPLEPYPKEFTSGFSQLEQADGQGFVWSNAPRSVLTLPRLGPQAHELSIRVASINLLGDIELTVSVNGKALAVETVGTEPAVIRLNVPSEILLESNQVVFSFNKTLHNSSHKAELEDPRDLAVMFTRIHWSTAGRPKDG